MTTEHFNIKVSDLDVEVIKKSIKNLHIGVYPPDGRVRVAAPLQMKNESIRLAIISRLKWIKKHQTAFIKQPREPKRRMERGESHFFQGIRYRLEVIERDAPPELFIKNKARLTLHVRPGTNAEKKKEVLDNWYRQHLKELLPDLIAKWEKIMDVSVNDWGVKKMKVKWGSCNIAAKRIWINLEMAKKPTDCLEYIVVHEMVHLLERRHNDRFVALMDQFLPNWRVRRDKLNNLPLAYGDWMGADQALSAQKASIKV